MSEWSYSFGDYQLTETEGCKWVLKRSGVPIYNSNHPVPLVERAKREGWLSASQVSDIMGLLYPQGKP